MPRRKKIVVEEETPPTEEVVSTELPESEPIVEESVSPEKTEVKETPPTLEEHLLALYEAAEPGSMNVEVLKATTGATEEQLSQMWDHLYDFGKVGFAKFVKP